MHFLHLSTMYEILLLLIYICKSEGYGYDSGTDQGACGKPFRSSRMHQPPCDLNRQTYCASAGTAYPWRAVRRFIKENQGLMRRMYGDERHISVLRAELQSNDVTDEAKSFNLQDEDLFENGDFLSRYSKQDHDFDNELFEEKPDESARYFEERKDDIILNTKFVYGQDPNMQIKFKDLQPPRFRPMTQKPVETTSAEPEKDTVSVNDNNKTSTTVFENTTETFYPVVDDEVNSTESGVLVTSTEDADTTDTTTVTEEIPETTTTQFLKKEPVGEVLFQDMENNKAHPTNHHMNYKLRGVNACPVKEEVVAPFWANNTRGEVLALLNMYPFEQYVHWEKCTYEHRQMYCRDGCRCEQQYRLHRLLAYDPNNECRGIFSDWFKFPSCCVCKCYDVPAEFRVTSRSPRSKDEKPLPNWFKKKNKQKTYNKN